MRYGVSPELEIVSSTPALGDVDGPAFVRFVRIELAKSDESSGTDATPQTQG
jgi:hypothetical protein